MTEKVYLNNEKIIKTLLILSFILTSFAIIILKMSSPVTHYELSVYSSIPLFWTFIIFSTSIAIVTIIYQVYAKNYQNFWISFFALLLNNFIILFLPYFRGYYLYGSSDPLGHLEFTRSIILNGNIGSNYYPITHILGAEITEIWSIPLETTMKLLPVIFTILFMIFTYFLATSVSSKREYAAISAGASATLLFSYYHVAAYPQGLSLFLFPLGFYLYFKMGKLRQLGYRVALILFLLLMPYTHAVTSIVLIFCLGAAEMAKIAWKKRGLELSERITFNPALISFITFFMWWSSFAVFGARLQRVNNWLFSEASKIPRKSEIEPVFEMGREAWLKLFTKMYGDQLIYFILSLVALVLILIAFLKKKEEIKNFFVISILFLTSTLTYAFIFMAGGFTTFGRFLSSNIGAWITPVLVASALFTILKVRKIGIILVASILIASFTLSAFSVYRSPWILQPNWQVTYHDVTGMEWYGEHRTGFRTLIMAYPIGTAGGIPPHFGYINHAMLGESLPIDSIILFGEYRQRLASKDPNLVKSPIMGVWAYPEFNEEDFNKLRLDKSVNKLYANGEFEILLVNPSGRVYI